MNTREHNQKNNTRNHQSGRQFHIMNTKSDPEQTGSPIPFQTGGFSSIDSEYENRKTFPELLSYYLLGLFFSISSFYIFLHWSIFKSIHENTVLSFAIILGNIIVSFILSYFLTKTVTKMYRKRK